ncbi:MAG: hypothetical protein ACKO8G_06675 [Actinomycetota bacterium]
MSDRGSVSIVVVAAIAAVMLLAAGLRDLAVATRTVAVAETAADAAALAAAQSMAMPSTATPSEAAGAFAALNGAEIRDCRCDPASFEAVVTVGVPTAPLWLFPDGIVVTATARAVVDLPV